MATPGRPVAAVERALSVLEILADEVDLGVNEIARRLEISPSSASRLLGTLAGHGLVERIEKTGRYRLGVRLLQLGTHVLQRLDVRAVARPLLEDLERATGETATLSLPAGAEGVTVDHVPSRRSVRSAALVGRPSVAHATAVGKVVLAFGDGRAATISEHLPAFTDRTITDDTVLASVVTETRERGWAEADREREEDLAAIAVPIFNHARVLVAILGVQGPADRFDADARRTALEAAQQAADELSRLLGR
jgi:IclR family acetate operon transcriptional repressor